MDVEVLPGPSLAERARTAIAQARLATVSWGEGGSGPGAVTAIAAIRVDRFGRPVLLLPPREAVTAALATGRPVTATVPAPAPLGSLALTGAVEPREVLPDDGAGGRVGYRLDLRSLRFAGAGGRWVPLAEYEAAEPDPLWRVAPSAIRHLEHGHMTELIGCVRAHGMDEAEWVVPRGLDRFGLELAVITPAGVAAVRLSFPDGPVSSLDEVPASLQAVLACRCGPAQREQA
jgi:heme iron utilization protein